MVLVGMLAEQGVVLLRGDSVHLNEVNEPIVEIFHLHVHLGQARGLIEEHRFDLGWRHEVVSTS